ncbi:MAG: hypothetical protein M1822_002348 [Bathelium mastoideum]|nr:MAG: hypothetical protein M1822_002348 [Bathelium mastoideum]
MSKRRLKLELYTIGWICALPIELAAAQEMLDEEHEKPSQVGLDPNLYTLGTIGGFHVVLVCLPAGQTATVSAATVATWLRSKFPSVQYGVMVGVGGGVPSDKADIRLGDIVISTPTGQSGGVVQYDLGKVEATGRPIRTGFLNAPPQNLLQAVSALKANRARGKSDLPLHLSTFDHLENKPFSREKVGPDRLFEYDYDHTHNGPCDDCDQERLVKRVLRKTDEIVIHYGVIASGNRVMKDAKTRDKLSSENEGVLCYEMEAAGLMNILPCLVIRGICDYSDSHKSKGWQPFAAAAAAACTKELLCLIAGNRNLQETGTDTLALTRLRSNELLDPEDIQALSEWCLVDPRIERLRILDSKDALLDGSCDWVFDESSFTRWWDTESERSQILWIHGDPGKGKTMMAMAIIEEISERIQKRSNTEKQAYFFCQNSEPELRKPEGIIRSLIYVLAEGNPKFAKILRRKLNEGGRGRIDGKNAIFALWDTLSHMIQESSLGRVYFLVDALDECVRQPSEDDEQHQDSLESLIGLLLQHQTGPWSKVKWILTSRNESRIRRLLGGLCLEISLEVNTTYVATAIEKFIELKVGQLVKRNNYSEDLESFLRTYLIENSEGTFLWVALVCKGLERKPVMDVSALEDLLQMEFPRQLGPLYHRMLASIYDNSSGKDVDLPLTILRITVLAFEPLTLQDIAHFAQLPVTLDNQAQAQDHMRKLIELCGSFLTLRDDTVYFVHQSAKDFFEKGFGSSIFAAPNSVTEVHSTMAIRAFEFMEIFLKKDIHDLKLPSSSRSEPNTSVVAQPLPHHAQYSCVFGFVHHYLSNNAAWKATNVLKKHFLHWIEALSFMGYLPWLPWIPEVSRIIGPFKVVADKVIMFMLIGSDLTNYNAAYSWLINDSNRGNLIDAPLQIYTLAYLNPQVRGVLKGERCPNEQPGWLEKTTAVDLKLESEVKLTLISPDGSQVAIALKGVIELWYLKRKSRLDLINLARRRRRFECHEEEFSSLAFSPDAQIIASASTRIMLHGIVDGKSSALSDEKESSYTAVSFSPDGRFLAVSSMASPSGGSSVQVWEVNSKAKLRKLQSHLHLGRGSAVAFSPNGSVVVAKASDGRGEINVQLWNVNTGESMHKFRIEAEHIAQAETFFHFEDRIYLSTKDGPLDITATETGDDPVPADSLPVLQLRDDWLSRGPSRFFKVQSAWEVGSFYDSWGLNPQDWAFAHPSICSLQSVQVRGDVVVLSYASGRQFYCNVLKVDPKADVLQL